MQKYNLRDLRAMFEPAALSVPGVKQRSFIQTGMHRGIPVYRETTPRKTSKYVPHQGAQEMARRAARAA